MSLVKRQDILEEAGLQHVVLGVSLTGLANGSNTVFTATNKPLADANYDDDVTTADVTVYVNGSPVTVSSLNQATGVMTLASAPANGATVTADYRYSNVSAGAVDQVRDEAEEAVEEAMDGLDDVPVATSRKIARWYAAGLLLTRDYGFSSDTSLTAKDGEARLKRAEAWLAKYQALSDLTTGTTSGITKQLDTEVETDPHVFDSYDRINGRYTHASGVVSVDDEFMRDTD